MNTLPTTKTSTSRALGTFARDALISIAFFQVALTPYLFLWLKLDWAQYGKWNMANIFVSAIAGPVLVRAIRWFGL